MISEFIWILENVVFIILGVILTRHSSVMEWKAFGIAMLAFGILRLVDCVLVLVTEPKESD